MPVLIVEMLYHGVQMLINRHVLAADHLSQFPDELVAIAFPLPKMLQCIVDEQAVKEDDWPMVVRQSVRERV